ncbi:hypothetical protein LDENG_00296890, partial [Lucifuga dentata]
QVVVPGFQRSCTWVSGLVPRFQVLVPGFQVLYLGFRSCTWVSEVLYLGFRGLVPGFEVPVERPLLPGSVCASEVAEL